MNPIFDLIIIGLIVVMVLLNLYLTREQSATFTTYLAGLREKQPVSSSTEQRTLIRPSSAVHLSPDSIILR